jgi:lycopene elongase/hydratase (dihydrobisanhydrobacterioruberin-forming)
MTVGSPSGPRALGYRLLGPRFDYVLHLRPAEWPILAVHFLTGSALAVGLGNVVTGRVGWPLVAGTLAFVVGLNGGTLALNSAFDRDEGDVAYLRRPPPPPRGLALFGLGLILAGLVVATLLPRGYLTAFAFCAILSVLYSVPPIRLKAVGGVDWIVNMAGFGLLTPFAGWAVTGHELTPAGRILLLSFAALFGALYPLTQLYQLDEDRRRGDRTLACLLGLDVSLALALAMAAVAFTGFVLAGIASDWGRDPARWIAVFVALAVWAGVLLPWWRRLRAMTPRDHQRGMHRALIAWAITDLAVLFAWAR